MEPEGVEHTSTYTQEKLKRDLDINSASKIFYLKLKGKGSYTMDYSSNGRNLIIGSRKGHIASIDWFTKNLRCEIEVEETVRDVV